MNAVELVIAFLAGVVMGGALDRFLLPLLVDAARAYLESLPELWAKTSDAGRRAIAEAVFERIDVLGVNDYTFTLTAHAKARGWDAAFGARVVRVKQGRSGRGERI